MILKFTHKGREYKLEKHHADLKALAAGEMTEADARLKPWYYRHTISPGNRKYMKVAANEKEAIAEAKEIITGKQEKPSEWAAFVAKTEAAKGVTVGELGVQWEAAGLAVSRSEPRTLKAAHCLRKNFTRALRWWADKPIAGVTGSQMEDFCAARMQYTVGSGTGRRAVDLELAALSSLCQWSQSLGLIKSNPFAKRDRFGGKATITHCHERMPESDDEWHRVLSWFWADPANHLHVVAGAWLAFTGLVGLRPTEPHTLNRHKRATVAPTSSKSIALGQIFPDARGQLRMRVDRCKLRTGQKAENPFVILSPVALEFLDVWEQWLAAHYPAGKFLAPLFPRPSNPTLPLFGPDGSLDPVDTSSLGRMLSYACAVVGVSRCTPKGFGRAFYVRAQRSEGHDNATIAAMLGQRSGGKLIASVYGEPDDMLDGGTFDWRPTGEPAWNALRTQTPANLIQLTAP